MRSIKWEQRINETKRWFFVKVNNIVKPLSKLTKIHSDNNKSINENDDITIDTKKNLKNHY